MIRLGDLNLFTCFLIGTAFAMLAPAAMAAFDNQPSIASAFATLSALTLIFSALVAIAQMGREPRLTARAHLVTVLAAYTALPLIAALPLTLVRDDLTWSLGYFEMLSAFTTTGASILENAPQTRAVHLWRSLVGWLGGYVTLLAGLAILQPLQLGGFEVEASAHGRRGVGAMAQHTHGDRSDGARHVLRHAKTVAPIYVGATAVLALILIAAGDVPFVAVTHAMAILSTSGISPVGGITSSSSGFAGEAVLLLFLCFGLSHKLFSERWAMSGADSIGRDREIRLAITLIGGLSAFLFLRHFSVAVVGESTDAQGGAIAALWGTLFTLTSFLTTTGFESRAWAGAANWSGLDTPTLLFLTLVMMGGGIATTAGGAKLLRVFALYKHGVREMERLVHPSSVGGYGTQARTVRREGAYIAWVFVMLFFLAIAVGMTALGLLGHHLEDALVLTVSALSNCGPLAERLDPENSVYASLDQQTLSVLSVLMVVGRMEALALIALFNPDYWRR